MRKQQAEIVMVKGQPMVKITGLGGRLDTMWAWRENGQIHYTKPERVPKHLRKRVIPDLFRDHDRKMMGY